MLCRSITLSRRVARLATFHMRQGKQASVFLSTSADKASGGYGPRVAGERTDFHLGDHSGLQQNHIWSEEELVQTHASKILKHKPACFSDRVMRGIMTGLYHSFNFVTGYKENDPSTSSIEWRLIVLESVAGVPGFLAAAFRHFHSLRTLERDHGGIFTFLEEAENERMHLLVCLEMFEASFVTRAIVVGAQVSLTPFLALVYFIKPAAMHRFVGYLEETAVQTYSNIVEKIDTPGTQLHKNWATLPAPSMAQGYWALGPKSTWKEVLRHILADEAHHRDVNHTFADLKPGATNPFVAEHRANFDAAVLRRSRELGLGPAGQKESVASKIVK